jgi:hypothetical protein
MSADSREGLTMDAITNDFWDVVLWSFWFFIWISAVMVWFHCVSDLFGDRTLSGLGKAGWALVLILLPWLGALIYLIARGKSMSERRMAAFAEQRSAQEEYTQEVAGGTATPAVQISDAKTLLESGTITETEFDTLKTKALA